MGVIFQNEMADRGIRTRTGKIYSPEQVKKLLSRRFYIGRLVWNGKEYHQNFKFDQKKTLLKAIFAKIIVRDKMIVGVELNPPFSILLREDLERVFNNHPTGDPVKDVFEQLVSFILSRNYPEMERLVGSIIENTYVFKKVLKAA